MPCRAMAHTQVTDILIPGPTLSTGRASGPWPGAGPGPALRGPGPGQVFEALARPSQGQGLLRLSSFISFVIFPLIFDY